MRISIMQPTYYPWLGYFDLIDQSDVFVFFDNVQLVKRSWQVRNRIKLQNTEHFLSIPIKKTSRRDKTFICEAVMNDDDNWRKAHLKTIEYAYKKAPSFGEVFPLISSFYEFNSSFLAEFNINIIKQICGKIGISAKFLKASGLQKLEGKKDELLAAICHSVGGETYISPQGSATYIEGNSPGGEIVAKGIDLFYHNYQHPEYPQPGNFIPYMAVIDLLFNCGFAKSRDIILSGRKPLIHYTEFKRL